MLPNEALSGGQTGRAQAMVFGHVNARFKPQFGLASSMLHVYVRPRLLPREEIEPVASNAEDSGAHLGKIPTQCLICLRVGWIPDPAHSDGFATERTSAA